MIRLMTLFVALLIAAPSFAGGVAVVDFQRAVTETKEGKAAQAKLDGLYQSKKNEIERMQADIQKAYQEYQGQKAILSDDARATAEQKLMMDQQRFEQTYGMYQNEMQKSYMEMLQALDKKMRTMTAEIGKEKGFDLVIDKAVVVYSGGSTTDITQILITRYNAK